MVVFARITFRSIASASKLFNPGILSTCHSRTITSKTFRDPSHKPRRFDWKTEKYTLYQRYLDWFTEKYDENSKIIVIEGMPCIEKTKLAKEVAEELDFLYFADANMDTLYINDYGYDMRQCDSQLPVSVQSFDEKKFIQDPFHINTAAFQFWMYRLRFAQYIDALFHLFTTGQGVVIERCPWSDMVFMEAMVKNKYMSVEAKSCYHQVKKETIPRISRPHLVIYLDVPVEKVMDNIKKRGGLGFGKALTQRYLQDMEDIYKTQYLPTISEHAELLVYDWENGGDGEIVVEDIERIDFEKYTKHDKKMEDWHSEYIIQPWITRTAFTTAKQELMELFNVPCTDAPELWASGEDVLTWWDVTTKAPGMEYEKGFNPARGEPVMDWLFKTKVQKYVKF